MQYIYKFLQWICILALKCCFDVNLILFSISQDIDVYDTMFILNWSKEGNDKIRSNIHGKPESYL